MNKNLSKGFSVDHQTPNLLKICLIISEMEYAELYGHPVTFILCTLQRVHKN